MIEDVEKNSNKSLGDNEIASLMKTLASKNYRENVSFPKKVIQPFKPISLLESANKNLKKNDDTNPENIGEIEISKENTQSQITDAKNEPSDKFETNRENLDELESLEQDAIGTTPKGSSQNELIGNEENTSSSEIEQITPIGIPVKENLYTKDELSKEYQKGYSEGVEAEQSKFNEEKGISLKKFDNLIKTIEEKIFIDTNRLEKQIKEEIIKITTERVGLLINEMPEEFLNKIKLLSNTIIKKSGKKIFKLNPEDLELVEKIIKGESALEQFVCLADNNLSRGDCIIEIGEISLEDKMTDRYDSSESSTRYFEIVNKENVIEEISQIEKDSDDINLTNETSKSSDVSVNEPLATEISKSEEVQENNSNHDTPEISEQENSNLETSQTDQDIEQPKSNEFSPDEMIEISEDENLTGTSASTSNRDQKDKDKT